MTFDELAEQCHIPEPDVRRLLRTAIVSHRIFGEPEEGKVAHSAASRLLLENQQEWDMAGLTWEEDWPAFARVGRQARRELGTSHADCELDRRCDAAMGR